MWWGAFGRSQPGKEAQNDQELTNRALRIAKFDKMVVSVFNIIVSVAPFAASLLGGAVFGLASSITLSLAVTFGFTTLYAIQTLSSFVSAESSVLLSTLPITQDDFSLITLFSFVRSVDYMVAGSIISQVAVVALLTGSPLASLVMLVAATLNQIFAVSIALWFSRVFQKNLLRGGRSKINTVFRLFFILMWGMLLVGVGFLLTIPWYIVPNLENILLGPGYISVLLGLLHPFSTGIVIASLTYSKVALATELAASLALTAYSLLAILAGKWSLGTVKSISQGSGIKITRITAKDFSVKPHGPLFGYVLKDLKGVSRNPSTAFFFALPVLETMIIAFLISSFQTLRTSMVLEATSMGAIFALFMPLALLTSEGKGLEYTKTLPISPRKIVVSKTLVTTATYALVPVALIILSLTKPLTSISSILIPFLITMSVASASILEIKLFLRTAAKGRISAIVNDFEKLVVGVLIVLIPNIAYAAVFLSSFSHGLSLLTMGAITLLEIAVALSFLRRS
jgi:predicted permease